MKKLTEEQKKERQKAKELLEETTKIESEKNQSPVKEMTITIEWKKSRMWGYNPHAEAEVVFWDNNRFKRKDGYTASGCGYDKESTVIAQMFNDFLKYKLWNKTIEECKKAPYGTRAGTYETTPGNTIEYRSFSGGIGTSCYYKISEFIGGKFEHIASGNTFDVYKYSESL